MTMLADFYRQGQRSFPGVSTNKLPGAKTVGGIGQRVASFQGVAPLATDQWGRPISPGQLLRDELARGKDPGMWAFPTTGVPYQTIPAGRTSPPPANPGGVAAPNGMPKIPGYITTPNGKIYAPTGNARVNALLATGLVNFGADLSGGSGGNVANQLNPQLVSSLFGSQGFTPAPFRDQAAPYVPPALGGVAGSQPPAYGGGMVAPAPQYPVGGGFPWLQQRPPAVSGTRYGFDNRYTLYG